jgi:hypothetical protein
MTETKRVPAQAFCLGEMLYDEMVARGWRTEDAAARMKTSRGDLDLFMLDLIMCVPEEKLLIPDDVFEGLGRAFEVDPQLFKNFHQAWLDAPPERRSPFKVPDEIFGPISRRQLIRPVNCTDRTEAQLAERSTK